MDKASGAGRDLDLVLLPEHQPQELGLIGGGFGLGEVLGDRGALGGGEPRETELGLAVAERGHRDGKRGGISSNWRSNVVSQCIPGVRFLRPQKSTSPGLAHPHLLPGYVVRGGKHLKEGNPLFRSEGEFKRDMALDQVMAGILEIGGGDCDGRGCGGNAVEFQGRDTVDDFVLNL